MRNTTRLLDIIDRAITGPICDEKEFDLKFIAEGVAGVVNKYKISFDKDHIIQTQDDMIDRVWEASLELFESCGVFNTTTGRRITFNRREIEETIKWAPAEVVIGEGTDTRKLKHREVEDELPPGIFGGPIGTPLREDLFVTIMQSYVQEPIIDSIQAGTQLTAQGREPRTRSPLELVAAWQDADLMFTALRRAGRPGLAVGAIQMGLSDVGWIAGINQFGYRPVDRHTLGMISELKTNFELLNKVAHSVRQGGILSAFYSPIFGGLGGGEEGMAVLITAGMVALQMVYMNAIHGTCPTHPFLSNSTTPEILRATSVASAAISRHTPFINWVTTSPVGGPCTEGLLYECVAYGALAATCGAAVLAGVRSCVGVVPNHCTGLEARFNGEVAQAAVGMSREEADEIVKKAVAMYAPSMDTKPVGKPFWDAYDPITIQPTEEWLAIYDKVKEKVASWGLNFI